MRVAKTSAVVTEPGLTQEQVETLRGQLADGRSPRVRLISARDDGGTGVVSRIGDPEVDGSEFITVRTKVGGLSDELPFAPAELAVGRKPPPPPPPPAKARTRRTPSTPIAPVVVEAPKTTAAVPPPVSPSTPVKAVSRRRRADAPPPVTISVRSAGASWSLSATRGVKSIAKSVPVAPGVITAITRLLAHDELGTAVAAINDKARAEAEERAVVLRAELAEVEALLRS